MEGDRRRAGQAQRPRAQEPGAPGVPWLLTTHRLVEIGARTLQCTVCRLSAARSSATRRLRKNLYCAEVPRPEPQEPLQPAAHDLDEDPFGFMGMGLDEGDEATLPSVAER